MEACQKRNNMLMRLGNNFANAGRIPRRSVQAGRDEIKRYMSERAKKKKEKDLKKQEAKGNKRTLDSPEMFAYVDEFGRIVDTPPDPTEREEINLEDIQISVPKDEDMEPVDKTRRGVVTMFNSDKGFGFIRDTDTRDSIFAHVTNMKEEVSEGDKVQFEVEQSHKGPSAIKVTIIK